MRENAFLVTKRFSTVIMLIFVTSTLESIDEYRFPGNSRKKKFSQTLEGTTGPKKYFVHYAKINLRQSWNRSGKPVPVRPDRNRTGPDRTG